MAEGPIVHEGDVSHGATLETLQKLRIDAAAVASPSHPSEQVLTLVAKKTAVVQVLGGQTSSGRGVCRTSLC